MDKRIWRYSTITRTTRDGTKEFYLYISEYGAFDCDILRQRDELAAATRELITCLDDGQLRLEPDSTRAFVTVTKIRQALDVREESA